MNTVESNPSKHGTAIFDALQRALPGAIARMKLKAPLVLSTSRRVDLAEKVKETLNGQIAGIFSEATMHTPTHVTDKAVEYAKAQGADSLISIGGGTTVGLGKAISVRTGLPHICIPTTYSGSEVTPILGETEDGIKKTRSGPKILPDTVIYDSSLTMTVPAAVSATSGVNAIAHAVEALYSRQANDDISTKAMDGIGYLVNGLPLILENPAHEHGRSIVQKGAWLCGSCLAGVDMAIHHKLCHTLGGSFNLPHAEIHTAVLPHALSYNAPYIPDAMEKLARAFPDSNGDAIHGLNVLLSKLNVKRAAKDFGMKEEDIDKAADLALTRPYWNPRPIERAPIRELLRRVWAGEEARADL
ncbi:uncharacterized protein N7515_006294 [Penicillium bovifimosum]|uniref:Alcohol dehydrogenase iron-type/glycerol dehydrogenase GldA domain-containing protein n=1 Tax=Penicillium bovifimosum TaxID=126998 RepID=A0A9W9GUC0_9EURO|nr:uncharacterized protein N7515_006294 [Penicillium bovifimosum]KAJ5130255.1 hypothetical protein N7515_006294 [Penicillium bovifimosum]